MLIEYRYRLFYLLWYIRFDDCDDDDDDDVNDDDDDVFRCIDISYDYLFNNAMLCFMSILSHKASI